MMTLLALLATAIFPVLDTIVKSNPGDDDVDNKLVENRMLIITQ